MGTQQAGARPTGFWPKVHLIYFLLAAFDLVAVFGGLYLSHRLSSIFEQNVAVNEEWSRRFQDVWNLGDAVSAVGEPGNNIFESGNPDLERHKLNAAYGEFNAQLAAIRQEVMTNTEASIASRPVGAMRSLTDIVVAMVNQSREAIALYESGQYREAGAAIGALNRKQTAAREKLEEAVATVQALQRRFSGEHYASVLSLKNFEYLIGVGIVFMVCCVVIYGHGIGRLIRRKYGELESANENLHQSQVETMQFATQLQAVNDDVTKLNRDLADNLTRLREAQDEIVRKSKMAQIGQLTATVAHELRNPLGAVRTSAFLLARKLDAEELGVGPQIERIQNGVIRCDNIITQLLDFARSSALQCETGKIDEWLQKTLDEEIPKLPKAVHVECAFGLGDLEAPIDAARMSRVIINLISNASEAMVGKGDDPSTFTTQTPRITIESRLAPRGIEIAVADNGPGITPENLKKIFEPLFTTKSFGTGLGLPAVEQILEQHGGGLEVKSAPGEGTRFTAWIPLGNAAQEAA
jgi:signal transduction histidine kinase